MTGTELTALLVKTTPLLVACQGLLLLVDELFFHRRRGLDPAEAIGHVFDSLLFCAAVAVPALTAPSRGAIGLFLGLGLLSSLLVTKDEWMHAAACRPGEHWLHALLFLVHGPVLIAVGGLWILDPTAPFLKVVPLIVGGWACYQTLYWTYHHVKRQRTKPEPDQQLVLRRSGRALV